MHGRRWWSSLSIPRQLKSSSPEERLYLSRGPKSGCQVEWGGRDAAEQAGRSSKAGHQLRPQLPPSDPSPHRERPPPHSPPTQPTPTHLGCQLSFLRVHVSVISIHLGFMLCTTHHPNCVWQWQSTQGSRRSCNHVIVYLCIILSLIAEHLLQAI